MARRTCLIAALAALGIAGCGGSTKTVTVPTPARTVTIPAAPQQAATQTTTAASPTECRLALTLPNVSQCSSDGVTAALAHGTGVLHLKTLDAQVVAVRKETSISNGAGISATARGVFVIVALKVTNTSASPQNFDGIASNQTLLDLNGDSYSEALDAENQADQQSFLSQGDTIQPGESLTGDLIYDVPPDRASNITTSPYNAVLVDDFGTNMNTTVSGLISLDGA